MQNTIQQKHIQHLTDTREQVRIIAHDFRQQVQILYALCAEGQYDELLC